MKIESKITLFFILFLFLIGGLLFLAGISLSSLFNLGAGTYRSIITFILLLLLILFLLYIGILIDRQVRKPLFFFIRWIDQLTSDIYQRPDLPKNFSLERLRFKPFLNLKTKLDYLTKRLQENEKERKELEDLRKNWALGVSHDLKTPLSYIKGYAAMLNSNYDWDKQDLKEFGQIIEEKSLYIEELLEDLSTVYQFDQLQIPLHIKRTKIIPYINSIIEDMNRFPDAKDYRIEMEHSKGVPPYIFLDPVLSKRALENIIMNAIYHNPKHTKITISLKSKNNYTCIEIRDNGIGMDEETVGQLFERHYRAIRTDQQPSGSGLGMSIAKQFIERQGAHIEVFSKAHVGTKIKIFFPNN